MKTLKIAALLLAVTAVWPLDPDLGARSRGAVGVMAIMDRVAIFDAQPLWPGFDPAAVPVVVFDGTDTYAFDFPSLPRGFRPVEGEPGLGVFRGPHPKVRANRRIDLDGVMAAACVAPPEARIPGGRRDPAAIIMHEKFHVFQALRHPDWAPNDAFLFDYPTDTAETVLGRRLEVEAFRRAIASAGDREARAWAACGLERRRLRLRILPSHLANYEDEVLRLEGLAEYVEWRVMNGNLLDCLYDLDFAPGAVRSWGYVGGRWLGHLLDRFDPGWKEKIESGLFEHPGECLAEAVVEARGQRDFSPEEIAAWRDKAHSDLQMKNEAKDALRKKFDTRLGWKVEISAERNPLRLRFFLADQSEAFSPSVMLHRRWLALENGHCAVEVTGQDCLTMSEGPARVYRVVVPGLRFKPRVERRDGRRQVSAGGLLIRFDRASVSFRPNTLVIKLSR